MRQIRPIAPADFVAFPWKNGGGVTMDIVAEMRPGGVPGDWDAMLWRLGRTGIAKPGPFSDMTGFERLQVVVRGRGLRLSVAGGSEIDVREPFVPVRFGGELAIRSVLDDGPVEVVNLILRRGHATASLAAGGPGDRYALAEGTHVAYAPEGDVSLAVDGAKWTVPGGHALRLDGAGELALSAGRAIVASVLPV